MYKLARTCKLLPKVITIVQRSTTIVAVPYDASIWQWLRLNGATKRLSTSLAEDKNIPCSDKTPPNTKGEQHDYYEAYGPKEILRLSTTDSSTDDSDCDANEANERFDALFKAITTAIEEAETQKEILAKCKDGELFCYDPTIKYEPLKRYNVPRFVFSEDSSTDWSDSESDAENETIAEEEAPTPKEGILAGNYDLAKFPTSTNLRSVDEDLAVSPSTYLQSKPAVPDSS
ncbi:hypothetical protein POM88_021159 [Heracleum sosnowskyi]|uniref:Uncharacterized protein n=1 Tax=Heracleum sosnowskyi TaxID=360622 RepID=A0AAD8ICV0_9APIA|nr:hypothetical protein POM88_021159 [Heracleum sosnowskyi]